MLVLIAFGLLAVGTEYAVNNNDWYRVTQFGGFYPKAFTTPETSFPFQHDFRLRHSTTMGIGVAALASIARSLSIAAFPLALSAWVLHAVFALGLVLVAADTKITYRWTFVALLLATYYLFGFYLFSFYEETTVLALLPILCYGYVRMAAAAGYLVFSVAACAIVYSKIQMLFVAPVFAYLLVAGARGRPKTAGFIISGVCLAISCGLASNSVHPKNWEPNSYNRYYNGLGWSLLKSWQWPVREFNGRISYYYSNSGELKIAGTGLPHEELLGTSYWPTGSEISLGARIGETAATYASVLRAGMPLAYVSQLVRHPEVLARLIANTYISSLVSDYSLSYLRSGRDGFTRVAGAMARGRDAALSYFGAICAVALVGLCALRTSKVFRPIALWLLVPLPALVVAGDGFYEFEKHMVPYMMLLPLWVAVSVQPPQAPEYATSTANPLSSHPERSSHRIDGSPKQPRGKSSRRGAARRPR